MDKPRLIIGNKNYSSWSLRAWFALAKLGVDFEEIRIPLFGDGYKDQLLKHSPAGKVPVYVHGNLVVWDSLAILEFLAELHPALWPEEQAARAKARSVAAEMHSSFVALREAMPMNCRASGRRVELSSEVAADIRRIETIWNECRAEFVARGPWLFGAFSIADAMYAPVVSRFGTYGVALSGEAGAYLEQLLGDPDLASWYEAARREAEVIESEEVGRV